MKQNSALTKAERPIPTISNLRCMLQQCQWALSEEIQEIRKNGGQKTYLFDGRLLGQKNGVFLYSFLTDSELMFPDDTPVDIEVKGSKYPGWILSVVGLDLILSTNDFLGNQIQKAVLFTAPWFLLEELRSRLTELDSADQSKHLLPLRILNPTESPEPLLEDLADDLLERVASDVKFPLQYNQDQLEAITTVISRAASFIWGPPGTGKTATLGLTAAALMKNEKSILIVAHSNAAVDVAMSSLMKYAEYTQKYAKGEIIRLGPTQSPELQRFEKLDINEGIRLIDPVLYESLKSLEKQRDDLVRRARKEGLSDAEQDQIKNALLAAKGSLAKLDEQKKLCEKEMLRKAKIIGCTLSKATISSDIFSRHFDVVLIDEASMAYIPHCLFMSSLASEKVAVFGDFRQLAPIAQADTPSVRQWLKRDIFDEAGIIRNVEQQKKDQRLVMLKTQYRMHSQISIIPNQLFYHGLLIDDRNVDKNNAHMINARPQPGKGVVFFDLGSLPAKCFGEQVSLSRFNFISALIAVDQAISARRTGDFSVGIIAPYNAQARLISRLLADFGEDPEKIKSSTVHKFQGSERDVILFDATDGLPREKPGLIYKDAEASRRLANVAVSRARGKFVFLCNRDYLKINLAAENGFRKVLDFLSNRVEPGLLKLADAPGNVFHQIEMPGIQFFPSSTIVKGAVEQDLAAAKEEVAIHWPDKGLRPWFSPYAMKESEARKVHFFFSGAGREQFRIGLQNTRFWEPKIDYAVGLVGIDQKVLWVFPDPQNAGGFVLRLQLKLTVPLLFDFWKLVPEKIDVSGGITCPKCKGKLWFEPGSFGVYMKCLNQCGFTRKVLPADATYLAQVTGKICERCGGLLVGKNKGSEIFLACSNYPVCTWTTMLEPLL